MKVVFITNIPAPYRETVHEIASAQLDGEYCVVYCAEIETNREWSFPFGKYEKKFIKSKRLKYKGRDIYLGSDIRKFLSKKKPDVIVIGGFSLPMIVAYFWAILHGKKIVSFSDANLASESNLSWVHKIVRKLLYGSSHGFVGASKKTQNLFRYYGAEDRQLFQSHLCANNSLFFEYKKNFDDRNYDIILCGQMVENKMFDFSLDVINQIKKFKPNVTVKILGSGELKEHILDRLKIMDVKYDYPGFVDQKELPKHYSSSKLFFFPTRREAWGVVANEACASGTPVITTPEAGAANELIIDGYNGFVLSPDVDEWAKLALNLLDDSDTWSKFSQKAKESVQEYSYLNAACGIVEASRFVRKES